MAKAFAKSFYNSQAWRDTRKQVLRRDLYTCVYCPNRAEEVHHIVPLDALNISDYNISLNPDNLISLCGTCHKKITNGDTGDVTEGYLFSEDGQVIQI